MRSCRIALGYSAGVQARVLGKPSTDFIAGCTVAEVPIQECEAVGGDPTTEPPTTAPIAPAPNTT